jgi:hypothetical protein
VERVNLPLLLAGDSRALLSFDELRERLPDVMTEDGPARPDPDDIGHRQERPIAMHVQLTGLRGLGYPIHGFRREAPVKATTYADWGRFELRPAGGTRQMLEPAGRSPLDFALASAASPGGFAPQLLDRSDDAEGYARHGIEGFPESGKLWYTDGGLLASQPLGRVIGAGRALHGGGEDAAGVHLLIDPRSEEAAADAWSDPDAHPTWQEGASRALAILSEQSLFDDLRRIEKDNSRIEWVGRLAELLTQRLSGGDADALAEFVDSVETERERFRSDEPSHEREREASEGAPLESLVHRALCEIAGLRGKEPIAIDVISPVLLADQLGDDVGSLLAGEFMGDFGGFLSRELRASDFALGYGSALAWLRRGLEAAGVEAGDCESTVEYVERRGRYRLDEVRRGRETLSDLSLQDRAQLVRLAAHGARVLTAGAIDLRSRVPDGLGRAIESVRERLPGGR